jgi:hypothetical protein
MMKMRWMRGRMGIKMIAARLKKLKKVINIMY